MRCAQWDIVFGRFCEDGWSREEDIFHFMSMAEPPCAGLDDVVVWGEHVLSVDLLDGCISFTSQSHLSFLSLAIPPST